MINFPLYAIRPYIEITTEGVYKIIHTPKNRYVLDVDLPDTTYVERRLILLSDNRKPYDIYPLNQRIDTVNQILLTKKKVFIDVDGKLLKWKPTTFYPVVCLPITARWTTSKGIGVIEVKGIGTKFKVSNSNYKYAQVIQVGSKNILFDLCDELRARTRKKL